jgi:dienelactone hydrolase
LHETLKCAKIHLLAEVIYYYKEEEMKKKFLLGVFVLLILFVGFAASPPPVKYSEEVVRGPSEGNHRLDCTVIRPWNKRAGPGNTQYPVIVWGHGWGGNDQDGQNTTAGYKPGLIEWAIDGPYIVIAANAWSVQEGDILTCIQWIISQNTTAGSEYEGVVNTAKIGLAGHSQGGGAVIKAGDGEPNGFDIAAVVAMNPYGPSWIDAGKQDGPVMLLGGTADIITPVSSFLAVWEAIQDNGQGGLLAVLEGGDHSTDAWGPEGEKPWDYNFGNYQEITELWWQFFLNDNENAVRRLKNILGKYPWDTQYAQ